MRALYILLFLIFNISFANDVTVNVIKPKLKPFTIYYEINGQIKADNFVYLKPEVSGKVIEINVKEGDKVKKGQLLAKIETDTFKFRYESQLYIAKKLEEIYNYNKSVYEKKKLLYEKGLISEDEFLIAQKNLNVSKNELLSAQKKLKEVEKQLKETQIKSPFDGVLDEKYVNVGDYVSPNTKLFYILDPHSLKVNFYLPQRFINKVKLEKPVKVELEGFGEFEGKISYISYSLTKENLIRLKADFNKDKNLLKDGMFCKVKVEENKVNAFLLPEKAVFLKGDEIFVLKVENGYTKKVKVEILDQKPGFLLVKGNIKETDLIVLEAPFGIKENQKVKIGKLL